jgi:hypothetical protein
VSHQLRPNVTRHHSLPVALKQGVFQERVRRDRLI